MARALANKVIHDGRLVTHLGRIKADQGDDISTAADFFIRMNGVTLAVVWAIIEGTKTIRLSARCSDTTLPLDAFLRERFPSGSSGAKLSPDGRGIGGGTVSVDFGPGLMEETMDKAIAFISEWIKVVTFKK
jgi:nanoRNase/pAp phosphatase (c-di-AMP/oligoRNAs hydrolase)